MSEEQNMKKIIFYIDNKVTRMMEKKQMEDGTEKVVLTSVYNFVSAGEKLATVINVAGDDEIPPLVDKKYRFYRVEDYSAVKTGEGVYYDENSRTFSSECYGFAALKNGLLMVLPPVTVSSDKVSAFIDVFPTKTGKLPEIEDIKSIIIHKKIQASVPDAEINAELQKIYESGKRKLSRILIAKGSRPVRGNMEYYTPLMDFQKKAGEIKEDGSIDFKEIGSVLKIKTGQEILQRIAAVKAVSGMDIYGNVIPAVTERIAGYKPGTNLTASEYDSDKMVAQIDGTLKLYGRTVHVLPEVVINGNLDYKTGNIDFDGSVIIMGSVLPGFKIKASGDVTVQDSIENGIVEAAGNVSVGGGIVFIPSAQEEGSATAAKVTAGGDVKARYVQNGQIEAAGNITVEDSIINSNVFSNSDINVAAKNGKIIGGSATALYSITAKVAGAASNPVTTLTVGRNLFIERELSVVRKEMAVKKAELDEIYLQMRMNFGDQVLKDPRKYIEGLPSVKKKLCLELLKKLGAKNTEMKALKEKGDEISAKLVLEREPVIIAKGKMYPGVILNIKKNVRKIDSEFSNVQFYEDPEAKEIKFVSAL